MWRTGKRSARAGDGHRRQIPGGYRVLGHVELLHSASGCRAGAAAANAGNALQAASMRVSVGYGDMSMSNAARVRDLRHEADVGERGRVAVAEAPGRAVVRQRLLQRLEADVDPVAVPAVLLLLREAQRADQVVQHAQVVERMDLAGDLQRDRAHARTRRPRRPAATAATDASRRDIR